MAKSTSSPESQISLFMTKKEVADPFRKAVQIVHSMPTTELTALQKKMLNNWLKKANSTEPDADGYWTHRIDEMSNAIDFNSKNRKFLKESASALQRVIFAWDVIAPEAKRAKWISSVLFPNIEIGSSTIRFQISEPLKNHVINPEMYALIDETVVRKYRRLASIGIYEHCVRFQKIGTTTTVPWQKFRDILLGQSANRKTYEQYKVFKQKVLNPSIAEINAEGAIQIELRETKLGKSVEGLFFKVTIGRVDVVPGTLSENEALLVAQMIKLGVMTSEAKRLVKEYSEADIRGALAYTNERKNSKKADKLENPPAYFRMALSRKWSSAENIEDVEPKSITPAVPQKQDIAAQYRIRQIAEAEKYFKALDADDQEVFVTRYNGQQETAALRLKAKSTKASEAAFFQWLMKDLWGDPTPEMLLDFAQTLLSR